MRSAIAALAAIGVMLPAVAIPQHHQAPAHQSPAHGSPYREQHATGLRGLSAKEIDDLRAGRGMGLARAAELNGYPGPRHVLDAARDGALTLSPDQRQAIEGVFAGMEREAKRVGLQVLAEEQALEAAFGRGGVSESELTDRVRRVAAVQAELREVHLRAHLATRAVLTDDQVRRYSELRGYAGAHRH
jgi:hypothetical protein